jgi:hypothetical protein
MENANMDRMESKKETQIDFLKKDFKIWTGGALVISVIAMSRFISVLTHLTTHIQ